MEPAYEECIEYFEKLFIRTTFQRMRSYISVPPTYEKSMQNISLTYEERTQQRGIKGDGNGDGVGHFLLILRLLFIFISFILFYTTSKSYLLWFSIYSV